MIRRLLQSVLVVLVSVGIVSTSLGQVKVVTIPQLQIVPRDSLVKLDTLQAGANLKSLQQSPYWHGSDVTGADTVRVTGVVMVKPGILTYTLARYNIYLQDTTTGQLWGGLNVLTNDTSTNAQSTGITALDTGDVATITGRVTEFGTQNNSLTEMFHYSPSAPIYTGPPPISVGTTLAARPLAKEITLDSLAYLKNGVSYPKPSSAEQYESMYVIVRNVTVNSVDYSSGRFSFQDANGNVGYMYDGSGWYTLRGHKISGSKYAPPPVGTKLSYLRGLVLPQIRSGTCGDYTIMPLYPGPNQKTGSTYPGDLVIGSYAPNITNVVRTPSPPGPSTVVTLTWKVKNLNAGGVIDSSFLNYKFNSSKFVRVKYSPTSGDSLYTGTISAANGDSLVSYYIEAWGGGVSGAFPDPSIPYFYQVRGTAGSKYTIRDIEYTPYVNGTSGFVGDTVTLNGTIIADTTDIKEITSNRPRLWMASAKGVYNGIPMWGNTAGVGLDTLKRGDSVQVRGVVSNLNSRTNIQVLSYTFIQHNASLWSADTQSMFSPGFFDYQLSNMPVVGTSKFAQWVGQLVQFNNMFIVRLNSDNLLSTGSSNFGEYFMSNLPLGATEPFGIRVDDNGCNNYYADTTVAYQTSFNSGHPGAPPKNQLLPFGAKISYVRGILDMSFSEYKLEPRKNDDYGTITTAIYIEPNVIPKKFSLEQNFPNPFNPSTTISYSIAVPSHVTLKIYNLLGQEVETLIDHQLGAGSYKVVFDASRYATGVYFYQLKADQSVSVKKMLLLK